MGYIVTLANLRLSDRLFHLELWGKLNSVEQEVIRFHHYSSLPKAPV